MTHNIVDHLQNKNVLVLGYGTSGRSVANYLQKIGANVFIYDDNLKNLPDQVNGVENIDLVVKSPAILMMPNNAHRIIIDAQKQQIKIISSLDLFYQTICRENNSKIIAVTGTNGKSTTVSMIYHAVKNAGYNASLGGNIGIPYFDMPAADYYVLEISSYEMASSYTARFAIGVLLNIADDHLEFHGNFANYIAAKHKLLDHSDVGIISNQDKFTIDKYISQKNIISVNGNNRDFVLEVCKVLSIDQDDTGEALLNFKSLPHRMQTICEHRGIKFINDSKATNPHSSSKALHDIDDDIYWLVGGQSKSIDPMPLIRRYLHKVKNILLWSRKR